jgi:hypothetical protein
MQADMQQRRRHVAVEPQVTAQSGSAIKARHTVAADAAMERTKA